MHGGAVDAYEGGYAAYVLARAERMRLAAGAEARRRNLMRKELAWLRRGPPARTSKPKFRIQAANELIANEPPPRDSLVLQRFATTRLGKDVFDLHRVRVEVGDPPRIILDRVDWSIGPGARIGLVGVNGTGKTSVLRLLLGELQPAAGAIKRGKTLKVGYLSQALAELTGADRVLDAVENRRRISRTRRRPGDQRGHPAGGFRVHRRQADRAADRSVRWRATPAAVPAATAGRAERAAARRAHQRPRHRHADRDRGLPGRLARHPDRGHPRPLFPGAGHRCHVRADRRRALRSAARRHRAVPGRPRPPPNPHRRPGPSRAPNPPRRESGVRQGDGPHRGPAFQARRPDRRFARDDGGRGADHVRLAELNAELGELLARKESLEEAWLAAAED